MPWEHYFHISYLPWLSVSTISLLVNTDATTLEVVRGQLITIVKLKMSFASAMVIDDKPYLWKLCKNLSLFLTFTNRRLLEEKFYSSENWRFEKLDRECYRYLIQREGRHIKALICSVSLLCLLTYFPVQTVQLSINFNKMC